jgi:hypothetical protein
MILHFGLAKIRSKRWRRVYFVLCLAWWAVPISVAAALLQALIAGYQVANDEWLDYQDALRRFFAIVWHTEEFPTLKPSNPKDQL